jgi:hypothetical protein
MARTSASDTASVGGTLALRRTAVALAVVAAHVALIFVMRGARHSAEVLDITLFALPITPEDRPREQARVPEPPISRATEVRPQNVSAARASSSARPHVEPSLGEPSRSETEVPESEVAAGAGFPSEPAAPVHWYAEARTSADALEQRERIERERRSLAGPKQSPLSPRHVKPACPFEKCEPNWGADSSIFESQSTKKGRIEKTPDGEVIRWTSNRCYQILVTPNIMHRGMWKCFVPLGKSGARGDLFKHMKEVPPPEERATDVP